ncbi:MAG: hypothetical protein JWR15_63, partial [Prosthecobacter sp.]|nr:hypothetical protein [Prosthecobacter sp.]
MKVVISSCIHPASVGGLAAYQRELASGLQSFSRLHGQSISVQHVQIIPQQQALPARPTTTSGPLLRFAETLSRVANLQQPSKTFLRDVDVLHFVGTTREILGSELWREAHVEGFPFTVWPSVHPENEANETADLRLYDEADAVFCQSDHERELLISRGVDPTKLIHCGLPPMCHAHGNGTRLRSKLGIGMRPAVLFVGRRDAGKGYPALLDAWPLVLRKCPDAVLLLAGPGEADEDRLAKISPESLRDLGCPQEQEKADAYAACDVFCLPSAHESFGIVYVEAWSYGKPVICGTAPASREL